MAERGRVLVVVPSVMLRVGLVSRLATVFDTAGSSGADGSIALLCRSLNIDIAIVDIAHEDDLVELLNARASGEKVAGTIIALLTTDSPSFDQLLKLIQNGVDGILTVGDDIEASLNAIRNRSNSSIGWVSPALRSLVLSALEPEKSADWRTADAAISTTTRNITAAEQIILERIADGLTDRAIAARIRRSERAVKYHVSNLLSKFGAKNRAHLISMAAGAGMLGGYCPNGQASDCPNATGQHNAAVLNFSRRPTSAARETMPDTRLQGSNS